METFIEWSIHSSDGRANHLVSQTSYPSSDSESCRAQHSKQSAPFFFMKALLTHSTSPSSLQKPLIPVKTSTPIPSLVQSKPPFSLFKYLPNFSLLAKTTSKVWAAVRKTEVDAIIEEARRFIADPANQLYGRGDIQTEIKRRGRIQ